MVIRDIAVAFGYEIDKNSEKKVNASINALKNAAQKALGAFAIYFSIKGLSQLAQAASDAEALESQFEQVFDGIQKNASDNLQKIVEETGMATNRLKGSFTQIAAFAKVSGMDSKKALDLTSRATLLAADSAAFYDKSIEEVSDALRSLLKGNFAVDASLGLSVTETTRNIAANREFGKSYKDLTEAQKQLTLLSMVEDANKASGALGQAARESDTWTNQLGNLKQAVTDLAAATGKTFLQPAVQVLKLLSTLIGKVTARINALNTEGSVLNNTFARLNFILTFFNNWLNGVKEVGGEVAKVETKFERLNSRLRSVKTSVERVVKTLGGAVNVLKLVAGTAALLFVSMNAGAIIGFMKSFIALLNLANLKILFTVGIFALLFLAVEDFFNFMRGNDSLLGEIFARAGIDADGARTKILAVWSRIKSFLVAVWTAIKKLATNIWLGVKFAVTNNTDQTLKTLKSVWNAIKAVLSTVWNLIYKIGSVVFGKLNKSIDGSANGIAKVLDSAFKIILITLQNVANFITGVFTGDWDLAFGSIKTIVTGAFDAINRVFGKFTPLVVGATAALATYKTVTFAVATAQKVQATDTATVTAAQKLFNVAVKKNPLMVVVTIIGALIAAFTYLFQTNEKFRTAVLGVWEKVSTAIVPILETIGGAIGSLFGNIQSEASGVLPVLMGVSKTIGGALMRAIKSILPPLLSLVKTVVPMLANLLKQLLPLILQLVKTGILSLFDILKSLLPLLATIIQTAAELISKVFSPIIDLINKLLPLAIKIIQAILPVIIRLLDKLIPVIASVVKAVLQIINTVLPVIIPLLETLSTIIIALTAAFFAYKAVILATTIAQNAMGIASFISGFAKINAAVVANNASLALNKAALIANKVAMTAMNVAQRVITIGQMALNAALAANPIGLVIAAVVALVAIFAVLWKKCDGFRNFWLGLWDKIKSAFSAVVDWLKSNWKTLMLFLLNPLAGLFKYFYEHFEGFRNVVNTVLNAVKGFFIKVWGGIKSFFVGVWKFLVNIVKTYVNIWKTIFTSVGNFFKNLWNGILSFFSGLFNNIKNVVETVWNAISLFFSTIFQTIYNTVSTVFTNIKDFISTVFNVIYTTVSTIWNTISTIISTVINTIWTTITSVFTNIKDTITSIITGVKDTITSIFDTIAGIATSFVGKFMGAFSGIKDFFTTTFGSLGDILKAPINIAISAINAVIGGINKLSWEVPDWVPGIGGKQFGFNIPEIPALAKGSDNAPDTFIAGEKGAELVTGGKGKKVFTALETSNIAGVVTSVKKLAVDLRDFVTGAKSSETSDKQATANAPNLNKVNDTIAVVFDTLSKTISKFTVNLENISNSFSDNFANTFSGVAEQFNTVFANFKGGFTNALNGMSEQFNATFVNAFNGISEQSNVIFVNLKGGFANTFNGVSEQFNVIFANLKGGFANAFNGVSEQFNVILINLKGGFANAFDDVAESLNLQLNTINTNILKQITAFFGNTRQNLTAQISTAISPINVVLDKAKTLYQDLKNIILNNIKPAEKEKGGSFIDNIKGTLSNIAEEISNAKPVKENLGGISGLISKILPDAKALANTKTASVDTGNVIKGGAIYNVTQNNYFQNTFNGERAAQQNLAKSSEKSATDVTGLLARGLKFAK